MKKLYSYFSSTALLIIIIILIVPSWRISFQGWVQGLFASEHEFYVENTAPIPTELQNWSITELEGERAHSFSEFNGKPIILSFWATWCPPCRAELSELKELQERTKNKAHFISVSEESIATVKESGLSEKYDFLYTTRHFPDFFQIESYPTLLIISPTGNVVHRTTGASAIATEKNVEFIHELAQKE